MIGQGVDTTSSPVPGQAEGKPVREVLVGWGYILTCVNIRCTEWITVGFLPRGHGLLQLETSRSGERCLIGGLIIELKGDRISMDFSRMKSPEAADALIRYVPLACSFINRVRQYMLFSRSKVIKKWLSACHF